MYYVLPLQQSDDPIGFVIFMGICILLFLWLMLAVARMGKKPNSKWDFRKFIEQEKRKRK